MTQLMKSTFYCAGDKILVIRSVRPILRNSIAIWMKRITGSGDILIRSSGDHIADYHPRYDVVAAGQHTVRQNDHQKANFPPGSSAGASYQTFTFQNHNGGTGAFDVTIEGFVEMFEVGKFDSTADRVCLQAACLSDGYISA